MRLFLYEFITAGGLFQWGPEPPFGSLLTEGLAMVSNLCADLAQLPGVQVTMLWDRRIPTPALAASCLVSISDRDAHDLHFQRCLADTDAVILIAPEQHDALLDLSRTAEAVDDLLLLSPNSEFVQIAGDKYVTSKCWQAGNVPTPETCLLGETCELQPTFPRIQSQSGLYVLKPRNGAGSQQTHLVAESDLDTCLSQLFTSGRDARWCVQPYQEGRAASISALCNGSEREWLPPCWQRIAFPEFAYLGGSLILESNIAHRIRRLAEEALNALPPAQGYVGIDLVIGDATDGSADFVIEVNPRLTTSYLGLRQVADTNLAGAMISWAIGQPVPIACTLRPLEFQATGKWGRPDGVAIGWNDNGMAGS